ncbi:MAG: serine/threonine protein kinase, partial [Cyanobacteria bacterium J06626_18]
KELLGQGQRFSETQIVQIATEILEILVYLHTLNPPVFHRDIKPSNLIWGEDEHVYLIDFGAGQDRAAIEGRTFTVVGTYGYTPMEQFGGRTLPASDIYALGATLIHLLTGIPPADLPQRDLRLQFESQVSLSSGLENWLQRATEPDIEKRFAHARSALEILRQPPPLSETHTPSSNQRWTRYPRRSNIISGPIFNHIQIQEFPDRLTILCRPEPLAGLMAYVICGGVAIFCLVCVAFIAVLFQSVLALLLFGLLILGIVIWLSGSPLGFSTRVVLDRRYFKIYREPPPFLKSVVSSHCRVKEPAQSIQSIIHQDVEIEQIRYKTTLRVVTVQTTSGSFSFGKGAENAECVWITETMNRWLGLS